MFIFFGIFCLFQRRVKTKRDLDTRVKEHLRNIKNGEIEESAVITHVWIVNQFY